MPIAQYNPLSYGKWYKFFIESNGSAYTLTTKDISTAAITVTGELKLPADFIVCDVSVQPHYVSGGQGTVVPVGNVTVPDQTTGATLIPLPVVDDFDYLTVFVFGYNEP